MTVHYHKQGKPVTVHMESKVFRLQDTCECCGRASEELYELHDALVCAECYGEIIAGITAMELSTL